MYDVLPARGVGIVADAVYVILDDALDPDCCPLGVSRHAVVVYYDHIPRASRDLVRISCDMALPDA